MAGTIVSDTLKSSVAGPPVFQNNSGIEVGQLCRAWVNFNGTGTVSTNQTIRASHNVSSVFKNATGNYTINFANAMPDSNYSLIGQTRRSADSALVHQVSMWLSDTKTSSAVQIRTSEGNTGGLADSSDVNVAIFR